MSDLPKCCGEIIGVQYPHSHPQHYDGVSEWLCFKCKKRIGRWSCRVLKDGEYEDRGERFRNERA